VPAVREMPLAQDNRRAAHQLYVVGSRSI
jgi:hypothetical protein